MVEEIMTDEAVWKVLDDADVNQFIIIMKAYE